MDEFFALTSGTIPPADALASGAVRIDGDPEALERCFRVLSMAPRLQPVTREPAGVPA